MSRQRIKFKRVKSIPIPPSKFVPLTPKAPKAVPKKAKKKPKVVEILPPPPPLPVPRSDTPAPRQDRPFKIAAVVPVHGRLPLVRMTLSRLRRQTLPLFTVIGVSDDDDDRAAILESGAVFLRHKNLPLGEKWQAGIDLARHMGATDILIVGSSDWVSDNWCEEMSKKILQGYDLVGQSGIFFMHVYANGRKSILRWPGYAYHPDEKLRHDRGREPIGAGRLISNEILNRMKWQCFNPVLNRVLDWSTFKNVVEHGGYVCLADDAPACTISISCDRWVNMHHLSSEEGWCAFLDGKGAESLLKMFPDGQQIEKVLLDGWEPSLYTRLPNDIPIENVGE